MPVALWGHMHTVGLRSHYVAAAIAAPAMIRQQDPVRWFACIGVHLRLESVGDAAYS